MEATLMRSLATLRRAIRSLERIAAALERIADTLASSDERQSYDAALDRWRHGQGKHPDD